MNKLTKYRFNLVEVMLAIVVLSLGMASIFVLFPAGLGNHRTAMAENSIADMAELVISHVRAQAALYGSADGFNDLGGEFSEYKAYDSTVDSAVEDTGWRNTVDKWVYTKADDGLYVVRQLSGPADDPYVDFAAVVRIYTDENYIKELFAPVKGVPAEGESWGGVTYAAAEHSDAWELGEDSGAGLKELSVGSAVLPLIVEISYPADVAYADRSKAYFRFEIFNEQYELKEEGATP